ncbi:MAG TPA: hypothetical protein VK615_03435 [Candidatus Binatia bacterium]|nr:hypothetical protein [Candidatus Binatia bacterium]
MHPSLELNPAKELAVTVDWDFFWRESTRDAIYGNAVNVVVPAVTSATRCRLWQNGEFNGISRGLRLTRTSSSGIFSRKARATKTWTTPRRG